MKPQTFRGSATKLGCFQSCGSLPGRAGFMERAPKLRDRSGFLRSYPRIRYGCVFFFGFSSLLGFPSIQFAELLGSESITAGSLIQFRKLSVFRASGSLERVFLCRADFTNAAAVECSDRFGTDASKVSFGIYIFFVDYTLSCSGITALVLT